MIHAERECIMKKQPDETHRERPPVDLVEPADGRAMAIQVGELGAERTKRVEAERIGRIKDEFLANLSHEIRTPLNAILGWAELLRPGESSVEDLNEGLDVIRRNARAQARLIEDLLDMSRIISGKLRLDVQRVDLGATITAAVFSCAPVSVLTTMLLPNGCMAKIWP